MEVIGRHAHPVGDFDDAHGGFACEQLRENAVMGGVQVLDEDEGHACVGWKMTQKVGQRFDTAGGGANRDNGWVSGRPRHRGSQFVWGIPSNAYKARFSASPALLP